MAIEDVDYLRAHSEKQSYIFLVDSKDRDYGTYPTPSTYVVDFTQPFSGVVGMEVLDASVPRTMYNVDVYNHTIRFLIHDDTVRLGDHASAEASAAMFVTATLEPGEYSIQTLVPELNRVLRMHVNNDPTRPLAAITAETTTNPPEVRSTLRFHCPFPFALDMDGKVSTIAETLGFDLRPEEPTARTAPTRYTYVSRVYSRVFHSVDLPLPETGAAYDVLTGPRGVLRSVRLRDDAYVAQKFRVTTPGYLTNVYAALTTPGEVLSSDVATWILRKDVAGANRPDLTADGLVPLTNRSGAAIPGANIPVSYIDGGLSDTTSEVRTFLAPGDYWILMRTADPNLSVFYNDVLPSEQIDGAPTFGVLAEGGLAFLDTDLVTFQMSVRVTMADEYHMLTAPGMYSLVGERYIVIRCPEIEENSYRSLAFSKYNLGLAKIRLGVVGYSENRLDFSKVPTREFHPIGKLSRLTLRFETSGGLPYDFKGVNHTITFAIHYLVPKSDQETRGAFRSIINPNYNPDFIQYRFQEADQESDSEDGYDYSRDDPWIASQRNELHHTPEYRDRRDVEMMYRLQQLRDLQDIHDVRDFQDIGLDDDAHHSI